MEQDAIGIADVVASSVKTQIMATFKMRQLEMLAKMVELANSARNNGDAAVQSTSEGGAHVASTASTIDASTSTVGAPVAPTSEVSAPGASTSANVSSLDKISEDPKFYDDIPSFDLHIDDDDVEICPTSPAATTNIAGTTRTTIDENNAKKPSSNTQEKKIRRKRAAFTLNQGKKLKRIRLNDETKNMYEKFLSKRILKKPSRALNSDDQEEPPPFVRIDGFYVYYEEFYKSFKMRGEINNKVMALWTYQFNIDEGQARIKDNNIVKKYAFSSSITDKLIIDPENFIEDSCNRMLTRLNNTCDFSKLDLFFPIVRDRHWVLIGVNLFLKQICWFNPINASKDTQCYNSAQNLVKNFSKACIQASVLNKDVPLFEWFYPSDYPQQNNLHDCGLYTMLYMEFWNGKRMVMTFEPHMMGDFRKLVAVDLLNSSSNEIKTSDFIQQYCNQEDCYL